METLDNLKNLNYVKGIKMGFREFLKEELKTVKVDDMVNFYNDLGKMSSGTVEKVTKSYVTIDSNGIKFKRKLKDIFEF